MFLTIDIEREELGLATFAHICIEVVLRKGIPDKIFLNWNNSKWIVLLDYENTSFHCHTYQQIGNLHDSCLHKWLVEAKRKGNKPRTKIWNPPPNSQPSDSQQEDLRRNSDAEREEELGVEKMKDDLNK